MAKIPELTAGGTPTGPEEVHGYDGTNSRRYTFAQILAILHAHAISDVTGLQAALDNKLDDSQAGAGGLAVLGAADAAAVRTAAGVYSTSQVDALVAGLFDFKGATDCSANPNYPAASKGDAYVVSVAGKIGGASGTSVDVGDVYVASADNAGGTQGSVGSSWFVLEHNGLYQASDAELTAIAGLTSAADKLPYFTGSGAAALADLTSVARTLLAQTTQTLMRTTGLGLGTIATDDEATAAQIQAGTAGKAVAADKLVAAAAPQTLTDGATVAWDLSAGFNAKVTIAGNRTLTVSNPAAGMTYCLGVLQDATGSRTMTWPASFDWGTTGAPTLTTTASKRDRITLFCTDAATPKFDAFLSGKGFS
jgi:hypothetical protein